GIARSLAPGLSRSENGRTAFHSDLRKKGKPLRTKIQSVLLTVLLLFPLCKVESRGSGPAVEPNKFFHDFIGLNDDQIREIREGKAIAKILESPTPDEVFVFGSVYVNSTPENYLKLASDIDALRKLPNYLALRKFSDPPQLSDLSGFTLDE